MAKRLLLVGWDAADWKILHPLVDAGEMPALRRIVEKGTSGVLLSTQPPVPAAQWTTLATGKRPWQHRICHPLKQIAGPNEPITVGAAQRRARTLWELLAETGKRSLVVGWPATHGERTEHTVIVSDRYAQPTAGPGIKPWPSPPAGTYWPEELGLQLNGLRMSPEDIQADVVSLYLPAWKKIDQKRDRRLGQLRLCLAADFSHQGAMVTLLRSRPWDFAVVRFPALGAISRIFLPYCPPRAAWVPEPEFEIYQHVLRGACRMLDRLLHQLVHAAGKEAAVMVVSNHGVRRQESVPPQRGSEDNSKSPHGIFAACGPRFTADALVFGATALDVTPTVLTWFGLPLGDDMEGRVLLESFSQAPEVRRVASWESAAPAAVEPAAAEAASPDPASPAAAMLQRETDWNLAQSYMEAGRYEQALPVLQRLFRAFPERAELSQALFQCQLTLEQLAEAGETLEVLLEAIPAGIWPLLLRAELCLASGRSAEGRALVHQAEGLHPTHPEAMRRLGLLLLRLREWAPLAALAKAALALDEQEPLAWLGLAEAELRLRRPAEAEAAALRALGLNYYLAQAHFVLARALIAQSKWQAARDTMQTLLRLQPDNRAAASYAKRLGPQPDGTQALR